MSPSFYATFTTSASLDHEIGRLRRQASIGWTEEHAHLTASGVHDGATVVEVGSGAGGFAARVLSRYPAARYTLVDNAPQVLSRARFEIDSTIIANGDVRLVCADASNIALGDACCDVAIARFVFQHLRDPTGASRELYRILYPNGCAVIIDADDTLPTRFDPPIKEIGGIAIKIALAQHLQGGDRRVGRKLPQILERAGFANITLDSVVLTSDRIGLEPFRDLYHPDDLRPLVDSGLISIAEWDAARVGLDRFFATAGARVTETRLVAMGTKPRAAPAQ